MHFCVHFDAISLDLFPIIALATVGMITDKKAVGVDKKNYRNAFNSHLRISINHLKIVNMYVDISLAPIGFLKTHPYVLVTS